MRHAIEISPSLPQLQSRSALRAIEQERIRIAREIHDELGQYLTLLRINIDALRKRIANFPNSADTTHLAGKLEDMQSLASRSLDSLRHIIAGLRPPLLDQLGLDAAVEWQAEDFSTRAGIVCEVETQAIHSLPAEVSSSLYRILQELLTNVARHSGATRVRVSLAREEHSVVLAVSDNGHGFSSELAPASVSFGLHGIRERTSALGGALIIDSTPHGAAITVRIPLASSSRRLLGKN